MRSRRKDARRAIEFVLQADRQTATQSNVQAVVSIAAESSALAAFAAERLLTASVPNADSIFSSLLARWAERDTESLFAWVSASAARLPETALSSAAFAIATRNPEAAASYTARVPVELRATWIARVAQGYSEADPAAALAWLAQYEGQPGHDVGMRFAVNSYATRDPAAAARVLATAPPDVLRGAAGVVADRWARKDPSAAIEWATGLRDAAVRLAAVGEAVGAWMSQSAQAAEDWTLGLTPGVDRDEALRILLLGRARASAPRETYGTNPTSALIEKISDADLRREAESWFAAPDARSR